MATTKYEFRKLPSIDKLLQIPELVALAETCGRDLTTESARRALDVLRQEIVAGQPYPGDEAVIRRVRTLLDAAVRPTLQPVINATGVILHTNLGRAPLSAETVDAMRRAGEGYSNLEFDLERGHRGSRYVHAEEILCRLTGAEAALLVNNNAGAVVLALSALAQGRNVVISRGQLVEIGGGFRIPEVMAQSGARLVEVGTTNRTYIEDYRNAISEQTAALMRVHSSNFRVVGFTYEPELSELVALAHTHDLLAIDDLGSGTLIDTATYGLAHEPMVQESVAQGVDLVTFSGDKLLGGPQAGILVGRQEVVERLRRFPLTRALRVDKTTIAGIQANLLHYVKGEALEKVPIWRMIAMPEESVADRARALLNRLGSLGESCELLPGRSMVGGGSLPEETLPTTLIALPAHAPNAQATALAMGKPPVVARIQGEHVVLDLRTVLPFQEDALIARLRDLLHG